MKQFEITAILFLLTLYVFAGGLSSCTMDSEPVLKLTTVIPVEGNCWTTGDWQKNGELIGEGGIKGWSQTEIVFRTYFKTEKTGKLNVALLARNESELSELRVSVGNKSINVKVENFGFDTVHVGIFEIVTPGYHFIEIQGLKKSGEFYPEIQSILIGGEAAAGNVYFARDDFYWGRRGPSVHLNFQVPENVGNVEYFYNEITVPANNDVLGSYFMACGFAQGYFGIQVNSETERRILFSVWSPYKTDNPGEIPEEYKIKLLKKGENVYTGEFGNEGSGGQSYYKYLWKAGTTYKFLLKANPTGKDETDFTAWFYAPEVGEWKLIAGFRRPKTDMQLTRLHSFLENFYTETGNVTRKGIYSNQWIYNSEKKWIEITKMKFTADATARKESRMDYSGGAENQSFFLQNCGFFSETTTIDSYFERKPTGIPPIINFEDLP